MLTATGPQTIDADAHVIETENTWDYLERFGIAFGSYAAEIERFEEYNILVTCQTNHDVALQRAPLR